MSKLVSKDTRRDWDIAEKVMGWQQGREGGNSLYWFDKIEDPPVISIAMWIPTRKGNANQALAVVDRMRALGWFLSYQNCPGHMVTFLNRDFSVESNGLSFEEAVCSAALKAILHT